MQDPRDFQLQVPFLGAGGIELVPWSHRVSARYALDSPDSLQSTPARRVSSGGILRSASVDEVLWQTERVLY
jgi:hypothetical protein